MHVVSAGNFSPMDTTETMSPALLGLVGGTAAPLPVTMFNMDTHNLVYTEGNVPMASDNDTFSNTTGALFQSLLEDAVDDFTFPNVSFESGALLSSFLTDCRMPIEGCVRKHRVGNVGLPQDLSYGKLTT